MPDACDANPRRGQLQQRLLGVVINRQQSGKQQRKGFGVIGQLLSGEDARLVERLRGFEKLHRQHFGVFDHARQVGARFQLVAEGFDCRHQEWL